MIIVDALSWVLLSAGGVFVLIGGVGVLRMPDLYTRMHAASVTEGMGALLILVGLMLQSGFTLATFKLFAILVFLLFTSPTAAYALVNTALMSGTRPKGLAEDGDSETATSTEPRA
jgi:multicomponent Na+:H+ antiporter subunit G